MIKAIVRWKSRHCHHKAVCTTFMLYTNSRTHCCAEWTCRCVSTCVFACRHASVMHSFADVYLYQNTTLYNCCCCLYILHSSNNDDTLWFVCLQPTNSSLNAAYYCHYYYERMLLECHPALKRSEHLENTGTWELIHHNVICWKNNFTGCWKTCKIQTR